MGNILELINTSLKSKDRKQILEEGMRGSISYISPKLRENNKALSVDKANKKVTFCASRAGFYAASLVAAAHLRLQGHML